MILIESKGTFYAQGPDAATVVDAATKNAIILGFSTPETSRESMELGIREAVDLLLKTVSREVDELLILP